VINFYQPGTKSLLDQPVIIDHQGIISLLGQLNSPGTISFVGLLSAPSLKLCLKLKSL
jgi:hypothetical protein